MLPRIHQLPDDLISRIAAGEVVERPASVLKELVENSLDAGATDVSVSIEGAGRTLLRISDNGCGMTKEEAHLAMRRHATSKISRYEDLERIGTFGFRGEALPSICSVSRLRMVTRSPEEDSGWEFIYEGGKLTSEKPFAREPGTTLEIRDLFFNTPARYKFLKSDTTERSQCLRVMEEIIFSSTDVSFHLQTEKSSPLHFQKHKLNSHSEIHKALRARLSEAWGGKWSEGLEDVFAEAPHFSLAGVVTDQGHHQGSPKTQILFVNKRPVTNRRLTRAVYDAYLGQLPQARHPGWVLFLQVNPEAVDVNVHPAKREVKITFENEIYGFMVSAIKRSLEKSRSIPVELVQTRAFDESKSAFVPFASTSNQTPFYEPPRETYSAESVRHSLDTLYRPSDSISSPVQPITPFPSYSLQGQTEFVGLKEQKLFAVGQVRNTFILAHTSDGVLIIDQHAAAEKIMYEQLLRNMQGTDSSIQMLLVPFTWEVSLSLNSLVREKSEHLKKMGFMIETFGPSTFLVKGYPSVLGERFDLHELLDGMVDVFTEPDDRRGGLERNFEHRLAALTACKASVKAGDLLDLKSCQFILDELVKCDAPLTCPHGRPTVIRLSYSELERRFRRT